MILFFIYRLTDTLKKNNKRKNTRTQLFKKNVPLNCREKRRHKENKTELKIDKNETQKYY